MKTILYLFVAILLVFLNSCVNVFQPLITPEKYLSDPRWEGNWKWRNQVINITEYAKSPLFSKEEIFGNNNAEKSAEKDVDDSIQRYHRTYILSFSDELYTYYYQMQMGKFQSGYYLQLLPVLYIKGQGPVEKNSEETLPDSRFNAFGEGIVSTYAFAKVTFTSSGELNMRFIDGEKIRQLILNGKLN